MSDPGKVEVGEEKVIIGGGSIEKPYVVPDGTPGQRGVYSLYPGVTPNYSRGNLPTSQKDLKVARLYLAPVKNDAGGGAFLNRDNPTGAFSQRLGKKSFTELQKGSYAGFFLKRVTEQAQERMEVVQLPGDNYTAYFFGKQPPTYTFDGMFLNTRQDQWRLLFRVLYEDVLRGTKIARHRHLVQIAYDTVIVSGYITGMADVLQAENELYTTFQFSMLVKQVDTVLPLEQILGTSNPFIANVSDFTEFAELRGPEVIAAAAQGITAFVDTPPRPKKYSGAGGARASCVPGLSNVASGANARDRNTSVSRSVAGPDKCPPGSKEEIKALTKMAAKHKKAVDELTKLKNDNRTEWDEDPRNQTRLNNAIVRQEQAEQALRKSEAMGEYPKSVRTTAGGGGDSFDHLAEDPNPPKATYSADRLLTPVSPVVAGTTTPSFAGESKKTEVIAREVHNYNVSVARYNQQRRPGTLAMQAITLAQAKQGQTGSTVEYNTQILNQQR